jgi:hypothetical protein
MLMERIVGMGPQRWTKSLLVGTVALLFIVGCAGKGLPPSYVHPNFDISFYKRLAVLQFQNLSRVQFASSRVRELVLSELLLANFEVLEPGLADRAVSRMGLGPGGALSPEEIQKLGKELKIQGVIVGTVEIYEEHRVGSVSVPEVSLQLRMIDVESGITVWSVAATEGGVGLGTQLLGIRPPTLSEATRIVVRRAVDTLFF